MKRNMLPHIVAWGFLVIVSAAPRAATEECSSSWQCRLDEGECKKAQVKACTCTMTILLTELEGSCSVANIERPNTVESRRKELERYQVQVCQRDKIVWKFRNECRTALTVELANFRVDDVIITRHGLSGPPNAPLPFDRKCKLQVAVGRRATESLTCPISKETTPPQTHKYDIISRGADGKVSRLDPEIEIYK